MTARGTCKEVRVILFADLPTVTNDDGTVREATDEELLQFGIIPFDRGSQRIQATCYGYWDKKLKRCVDYNGNSFPGILLTGKTGMYRRQRNAEFSKIMQTYENGTSGGRNRLMLNKLSVEFEQRFTDPESGIETVTPAITLTEGQRLAKRLPKIFGDG